MKWSMWLWLALSLATVFAVRVAGPSDINDKNQPETIAYTVDMVRNGQWVLPRSSDGSQTTKPLLYNWLSAPLVMATGRFESWVFKVPSVFAGLGTLGLIVWMTRRMVGGFGVRPEGLVVFGRDVPGATPIAVALLAGMLWLASPEVFRQVYHARPDGLMVMFVTGAWIAATVLLESEVPRRFAWQLALWGCVGGAALSKGPAALLPVIYAPLAARLIQGRWSAVNRVGWWWGLPLAAGMFAAWLIPAWREDGEYVVKVLMGTEFIDRIRSGKGGDGTWAPWKSPLYVIVRFLPWSLFAVVLMARVRVREWFTNPLGPAFLWTLVVTAFFACSVGIIPRYLLPALPAVAAMAAVSLVLAARKWRWRVQHLAAWGYVGVLALSAHHLWWSEYATLRFGDGFESFARDAAAIVGDDPVRFETHGRSPLTSLMGRHLGGPGENVPRRDAAWVIRLVYHEADAAEAALLSRPLGTVNPYESADVLQIGLFRNDVTAPQNEATEGGP